MLVASMLPATATPIFANALTDSQFVTSFGSGDVTGPPDGGGLFLGDTFDPPTHPGFITVKFATPLGTGAGVDFQVFDVVSSPEETFSLFASSDGVAFTFVGGGNAVASGVDIDSLFLGPINFLKVANSSTSVSIDVDAVAGFHEFTTVPEVMSTLFPFALGAISLLGLRRFTR
jgi:hypothetical protein